MVMNLLWQMYTKMQALLKVVIKNRLIIVLHSVSNSSIQKSLVQHKCPIKIYNHYMDTLIIIKTFLPFFLYRI